MPWLGPGGTNLALAAWTGLENTIILSPCMGSQGDMHNGHDMHMVADLSLDALATNIVQKSAVVQTLYHSVLASV